LKSIEVTTDEAENDNARIEVLKIKLVLAEMVSELFLRLRERNAEFQGVEKTVLEHKTRLEAAQNNVKELREKIHDKDNAIGSPLTSNLLH
ncbi:hypothetical protein H0H87_009872, partial [Tephrocybe sp. NHM501043]